MGKKKCKRCQLPIVGPTSFCDCPNENAILHRQCLIEILQTKLTAYQKPETAKPRCQNCLQPYRFQHFTKRECYPFCSAYLWSILFPYFVIQGFTVAILVVYSINLSRGQEDKVVKGMSIALVVMSILLLIGSSIFLGIYFPVQQKVVVLPIQKDDGMQQLPIQMQSEKVYSHVRIKRFGEFDDMDMEDD